MNEKKGNFWVNMSHSLLPQKGPFLSCTTVTLTAAGMFIKIRNMGNCHYERCKKPQEHEIIHIISHLLIRQNPTVKRQETKPGNKVLSCSRESKFIFLLEQNSVSPPCVCMMSVYACV